MVALDHFSPLPRPASGGPLRACRSLRRGHFKKLSCRWDDEVIPTTGEFVWGGQHPPLPHPDTTPRFPLWATGARRFPLGKNVIAASRSATVPAQDYDPSGHSQRRVGELADTGAPTARSNRRLLADPETHGLPP